MTVENLPGGKTHEGDNPNGLNNSDVSNFLSSPEKKSLLDVFNFQETVKNQTFMLANGVFFRLSTTQVRTISDSIDLKFKFSFFQNPKKGQRAVPLKPVEINYKSGEAIEVYIDRDTKVRIMNVDMGNGVYSLVVESIYASTRMNGDVEEDFTSTEQVHLMGVVKNGFYSIVHLSPKNDGAEISESEETTNKNVLNKEIQFGDKGIFCKIEEVFERYVFDYKEGKIKGVPKKDKSGQPYFRINFYQTNDQDPTSLLKCGQVIAAFGSNPQLIMLPGGEMRAYLSSVWREHVGTDGRKIILVEVVKSKEWENGRPVDKDMSNDKAYIEIQEKDGEYILGPVTSTLPKPNTSDTITS